jgi:hypothetical protein
LFRSRRAHASGFDRDASAVVPHPEDFESVSGMGPRCRSASWWREARTQGAFALT